MGSKAKWTALCLLIVPSLSMLFLYFWQYLIDPRFVDSSSLKLIVSGLARSLYGERCRDDYKITDQIDAINFAKTRWKNHARNWIAAGDTKRYEAVFSSDAFKNPGTVSQITNQQGWAAARSEASGQWGITFDSHEEPSHSAYLSIAFSICGRTLDIGDITYVQR
jgi:hypothetical protein